MDRIVPQAPEAPAAIAAAARCRAHRERPTDASLVWLILMDQDGVVIIGGAIIGSLTAYFLRHEGYQGRILVLERDPTYAYCSTALSAASIRTQFGCPINVRMSMFGASFLRNVKQCLGSDAEIGFRENGYLILGGVGTQEARSAVAEMQVAHGASIAVLPPEELRGQFPWLNTDGVDVGTLGLENEGWFDAWSLLHLVRSEAKRLGVEYRHGEASGFESRGSRVVAVRATSGEVFAANWVVNAAGPASGRVASWIGIPLPVSPRKRTVFYVKAPLDGGAMPMLFDVGGAWIRPDGDGFICGIVPSGEDPDAEGDFAPDHALFEDLVWPALAHRIPALESLRVERAWAGHYEVNALDHNGVVGPHDAVDNFIFACGFSGHGVMHAPATGRAVAELIVHGRYRSLDLAPLGYARVRDGRPMIESAVY